MKMINKVLFAIPVLFFVSFAAPAQDKKPGVTVPEDIDKLLKTYTCFACHKADTKLVGPAYTDVAARNYKDEQIVELIYNPKPANWPGYPPMTPMKHVPKPEALKIAKWINSLNRKGKSGTKK